MIVIDNTVVPGVVVTMEADEDDVLPLVERYTLATGKAFDVYVGEEVVVLTLAKAQRHTPSRPSEHVEVLEAPPLHLIPPSADDENKPDHIKALEAEAYAKMAEREAAAKAAEEAKTDNR